MKLQTVKYNTDDAIGYITYFKSKVEDIYYIVEYSHETTPCSNSNVYDYIDSMILSLDSGEHVFAIVLSDADIWGLGRSEDIILSN